MPSEHTLIFISSILELLVLLFVAYEVIVGEMRHRRAAVVNQQGKKPAQLPAGGGLRSISLRLGLFIVLVSMAIWLVIYVTYGNGSFLVFNEREPNTGPIVWNFEQTARGAGYFLTTQKIAGQPEIRVISFGARGKNRLDKAHLEIQRLSSF